MVLTIGVLAACGGDDTSAPRETERSVQIVPHQISYKTETTRIEAVGTARARSAATIFPETDGEVIDVAFQAGDHVEKGDILLRMESRAERLAVDQAQVALKDAERLIARYGQVSTPGVIAGNEVDRAQAAYDAARIQLDIAQDALADRTVRAPFSGHVGLTNIDPGARINTDTVITRLDDRNVLFVDFPAPEQSFNQISTGDIISVEPFSAPGSSYEAEIVNVDTAIDTTTRAFTIRAAINNPDDLLRPGMSFRIGFDLPGQSYPSVPEASIVWGGDGAFLWGIENGKAARVPVTIISRDDGEVLVKADLPKGTWIIEEGVQKVREGTPVKTPDTTRVFSGPENDHQKEGGPSAAQP